MLTNLKIQLFLRGTSQKLLAKAVGTDETALSKIMHGSRLATPAQRRAIAKYLEADEDWLFESVTDVSSLGLNLPLVMGNSGHIDQAEEFDAVPDSLASDQSSKI